MNKYDIGPGWVLIAINTLFLFSVTVYATSFKGALILWSMALVVIVLIYLALFLKR